LHGVIELFCHFSFWDSSGEAAFNLLRYGQGEHENLARSTCMFGCSKNGTKVVGRMSESTWYHVAVQEVDVTGEAPIEKGSLI